MSVYKHDYRPFAGKVTPRWMRIYVLSRYGAAEAWSSKITVGLFVLSLLPLLRLARLSLLLLLYHPRLLLLLRRRPHLLPLLHRHLQPLWGGRALFCLP